MCRQVGRQQGNLLSSSLLVTPISEVTTVQGSRLMCNSFALICDNYKNINSRIIIIYTSAVSVMVMSTKIVDSEF